jgi:hypothetical protein
MVHENDVGKLNINGIQQPMNFNYQGVNAFSVTDLPHDPITVKTKQFRRPDTIGASTTTYNQLNPTKYSEGI